MAEDRKLSAAEVRKTIAASLTTAFGFVIALLWNQVVQGGLALAKVSTTAPADSVQYVLFIGTGPGGAWTRPRTSARRRTSRPPHGTSPARSAMRATGGSTSRSTGSGRAIR